MNLKNKALIAVLGLAIVGTFGTVLWQGIEDVDAGTGTGLYEEGREFKEEPQSTGKKNTPTYDEVNNMPLISNYYTIEGTVGDTIPDFELSMKGKVVKKYTVISPTSSIKPMNNGIKLVQSGEGEAKFMVGNEYVKVSYDIEPGPEEDEPEDSEEGVIEEAVDIGGTACTLSANGELLTNAILYIDDSKNAFKISDNFVIPDSAIDGETHTLYLAKFTKQGPVAYKVTEFTSLAGEVSFINYNSDEVKVNGKNITLLHGKNGLL